MKRNLAIVSLALAGALVIGLLLNRLIIRPPWPGESIARVFTAACAYKQALEVKGQPVPATVSLEELRQQSLIGPEDLRALEGLEVVVSLTASETRPQEVLVRVRFPDGEEMAALADGSVQVVKR